MWYVLNLLNFKSSPISIKLPIKYFLTLNSIFFDIKRDKSMNPDNMEYLIFAKERFMGEGLNTLHYDRIGKKNAYEGLYAHIKVLL